VIGAGVERYFSKPTAAGGDSGLALNVSGPANQSRLPVSKLGELSDRVARLHFDH